MPYTYRLTSIIPATPQQIYEAWLDSVAHSEMTGGEAKMSEEVGAEVSAWGGYITGSNLELVPGERIVQSWRTSQFGEEHEDSIVTVTLEETDEGTLLTLVHSNVPDEHRSYEEGGWESHYFEPMRAYFAGLEESDEDEELEEELEEEEGREPEEEEEEFELTVLAPAPQPAVARKSKAASPGKKSKRAAPAKARPKKVAAKKAKPKKATAKKTKKAAAKKIKAKARKSGAKKAVRRAAPKRTARRRKRSRR